MKRSVLGLVLGVAIAPFAHAAPESWVVATDLWGNRSYETLMIDGQGAKLTGTLGGRPVTGQRSGKKIVLTTADGAFKGEVDGDRIVGVADLPDTNDVAARAKHEFTARRVEARASALPRTIDFVAASWSNLFSQHREPVLTIWPGDTVRTSTIDSGGVDSKGVTQALYGNPQVGPFFVVGAEPGDTLVVHLKKIRINRDFADSRDDIVERAMATRLAPEATDIGNRVRWRLDLDRQTASPERAEGAFVGYSLPVRPMLGGLAVAPSGSTPISTGEKGVYGGNMDFNEVVEGNTVYLPVQQPGALLYLGDGHALQGDGETSQWGLETSLDVVLTVDVIKGKAIQMPLIESPTEIMAVGQGGSVDEALRAATHGLVQWLRRDYGMTLSQSAQILGATVKYSVTTLTGRIAGVAARIDKARLPQKERHPPTPAAAAEH